MHIYLCQSEINLLHLHMEQRVADHIAVINGVGRILVTTSVYDMVDRCTEVNHPASGITSFTYDLQMVAQK